MAALIGREPFTDFSVAVRCPFGGPAVVRNAPLDLRGRPFPTRDWLACRALGEAVSRLEAAGGVRQLEDDPQMAPHVAEAHRRHAELHAGYRVAGSGDPRYVKCLHAHLAFGLAEGGTPVSDWIMERSGAAWPARCCLDRLGEAGGR
ncbi:DUF501 domain-containing protein [Miltoncostaea marina]|uniref:DUF501 domain-containing protein n=1 Tax=Miltoncostaea marina TaxID=2843215 RepID=UPI001C3D2ACC|nr:DUF501 domain-containing protein [Miltoncostaea marina]